MKLIIRIILSKTFLISNQIAFGQLKVSTSGNTNQAEPSSILELESTNRGLLLPRVNDLNSIVNPSPGLIVFLSSESNLYYYSSKGWTSIIAIDTSKNLAKGNNSLSHILPDPNNGDGENNFAIGNNALSQNTIGRFNTCLGNNSLRNLISGSYNIGIGNASLFSTTTGLFNIALGDSALYMNTVGQRNISIGTLSLRNNTGNDNTSIGYSSMNNNTTGIRNTSLGMFSNYRNQIGNLNTGIGFAANYSNVSGRNNVGIGAVSLRNNQSGSYNIAVGDSAAFSQISGNNNIAIGSKTVLPNTSDSYQLNIGNEIYGKYVGDPNHSVQIGIGKNNPDATLDINGDLKISGTNANLIIERGPNSLAGTVSLDQTGAATVYNSKVTANSIIFLTSQNNNSGGTFRVTNINPGVSFSIETNDNFTFENSKIGYLIIN